MCHTILDTLIVGSTCSLNKAFGINSSISCYMMQPEGRTLTCDCFVNSFINNALDIKFCLNFEKISSRTIIVKLFSDQLVVSDLSAMMYNRNRKLRKVRHCYSSYRWKYKKYNIRFDYGKYHWEEKAYESNVAFCFWWDFPVYVPPTELWYINRVNVSAPRLSK